MYWYLNILPLSNNILPKYDEFKNIGMKFNNHYSMSLPLCNECKDMLRMAIRSALENIIFCIFHNSHRLI